MSKWKITSTSSEQTESIGELVGKNLNGGEIIELQSDLGGGKTTLTKGIARGLGVSGIVSSPTFVVSRVYRGDALELHHYDFYRLEELGIMSEELQEVIENVHNVTVIEWVGRAHDLLPSDRLLHVDLLPQENQDSREIIFSAPDKLDKVMELTGAVKC